MFTTTTTTMIYKFFKHNCTRSFEQFENHSIDKIHKPNNCLCSSETSPCQAPVTAQLLSCTLLVGVGLSDALLDISVEPFLTVSLSAPESVLVEST